MMDAVTSATAMAWDLAGRPAVPGTLPEPGTCAVCGFPAAAVVPFAPGGNFTGQDLLAAPWSGVTCAPCAWSMAGRPPASLRNWTIAIAPGRGLGPSNPKSAAAVPGDHPGLLLCARDDMRPVAALLCDPPAGPWAVAVAVAGHRHCLPWAPVNSGDGPWQVSADEQRVAGDPAAFRALLRSAASLGAAGLASGEILALDPGGKLNAARLPAWRAHAPVLAPWRDSPLLALATLMITKEHRDHYAALPA